MKTVMDERLIKLQMLAAAVDVLSKTAFVFHPHWLGKEVEQLLKELYPIQCPMHPDIGYNEHLFVGGRCARCCCPEFPSAYGSRG